MDVVILIILAMIAMYGIVIFNSLVAMRNRFKNAFAQIDVQLQRRHELIPNLVETAKAYMAHEKETLSAVIAARNHAVSAAKTAAAGPENAAAIQSLMTAENTLSGSLGRLFALAENYPDIKANQTMAQLMEELSSTENRVSFSRQAYNDAVMQYNTYREQFPNSVVAGFGSFREAQLYEPESPDFKQPVKVSF
jgi:LemA protein